MVFSIVCYAVVTLAVLAFVGSGRRPVPTSAEFAAAIAIADPAPMPNLFEGEIHPDGLTAEELLDEGKGFEVCDDEAPAAEPEPMDWRSITELILEFPAAPVTPQWDGVHIFTLRALGSLDRVKGAAKWRRQEAIAYLAA